MILNFKILYFYLLPFQNYAELQLILLIVSLLEYMDECPISELQYGHTVGQYGHTIGQYGDTIGHKDVQLTLPELSIALEQR